MNALDVIRKIKQFDGRVFCGYLQPAEAKILIDAKCVFKKADVEYVNKAIAEGNCKPRWFYFSLNKVMAKAFAR